jgi:hypothetical protein
MFELMERANAIHLYTSQHTGLSCFSRGIITNKEIGADERELIYEKSLDFSPPWAIPLPLIKTVMKK